MKRISISIVFLACLAASNVTAHCNDFDVTENNWDYNAAHASSAAVDGDKPLDLCSQGTGYCGLVGSQGEGACGSAMSSTAHEAEFELWMAKHGKTYQNKAEKERRFKIFKANLEYVENFNSAGNRTFKLGINKYSDLTYDEFAEAMTGDLEPDNLLISAETPFTYAGLTEVPKSLDWRDKGAVTPVKDQGRHCEQQLMDCSGNNHSCDGGNKTDALRYIIKNGGLTNDTKDGYPYQAKHGICNTEKEKETVQGSDIIGYGQVTSNNEAELLKAVSQQPVAVSIRSSELFHNYNSGIFNDEDCETSDRHHAVTIVGYGTSEGLDYWLVKNSWGETWGEKGYIRMQRNVPGKEEGVCGIARIPVYPIAKKIFQIKE
ncbi:hypothetical protein PTKIN_Ptkin14bG0185100 [Pterospermum kingtungense]